MDPIQDKSIPKVTEPLKSMLFYFGGHPFEFFLEKPSVKFALLAISDMWSPHSRFSLMLTPKSGVLDTFSSVTPLSW